MKMRNYYLLMLVLCGAGAVFGGLILVITPQMYLPLRLILWALTLCYIIASLRYKRLFEEADKREREHKHHRRNPNHPENSFYSCIRRSV